jgi:hypothetical protein
MTRTCCVGMDGDALPATSTEPAADSTPFPYAETAVLTENDAP